ncbi:MAG: UDP-N-acetylmuramoyl-L-alanine--D-glutamate ligase [Candidatus Doudnabacteria bacterium]
MLSNLKGKKIAVVGMGTNNKKLAEYLTGHGLSFDVIENWKDPAELVGRLDKYEIIFRTPGLPFLSKAVRQASEKGVEVSSQTKLFFKLCPAPIIGVTGTKGKGTTSSLLAKILQTSGKKTWLGGNMGRDPFEFLESIKPEDFVVLELSSFQLQDLDQSPHIGIVLNITADHLNHHLSVEEYVKAKSSIVAYQGENDFAVLHPDIEGWFKDLGKGKKIFFDPKDARRYETKLLGTHNLENIAAAAAAAQILAIGEPDIRKAIAEFEPLPHRLNKIREIAGISFIDDAFSTNIDPVIAAIEAIKSPLILIIGGFDKGLNFSAVGQKIKSAPNVKGLVVIGEVSNKVLEAANGFTGKILTGAENMKTIIGQARSLASAGDTILFSPGTSSFDMFKNESDRGEQFVNAVNSL